MIEKLIIIGISSLIGFCIGLLSSWFFIKKETIRLMAKEAEREYYEVKGGVK